MTDLKNRFMLMLTDEPAAPNDIEHIVTSGRRARRRRQALMATASTVGAAGVGAAVAIPLAFAGGGGHSFKVATSPSTAPTPSGSTGKCYVLVAPSKGHDTIDHLLRKANAIGKVTSVTKLPGKSGQRAMVEACTDGAQPAQPRAEKNASPKGPSYTYDEEPTAIAARLGSHLHASVTGFGLTITYTRPFSQESSKLGAGHPSYYGGNVDVHQSDGYADIGVQVTHRTTTQVPFDGDCTAADNCEETTLPDGSVMRTGEVTAGPGLTVITAEVHRPDGVVVQAQMSNYPFGPDAGTQQHGDQPLSLKQLISLAEDPDFTF